MTKSTITREQLEEWVAQFDEDGGCDATDSQLEALIRQSLAAMDSEPVAEVLSNRPGNDTSTIDRALPVGTKLYRHAQQPVVLNGFSVNRMEMLADRLTTRITSLEIHERAGNISSTQQETLDAFRIALEVLAVKQAQLPGSEPATVPGKWIPVSERIPEEGGRYWCYVEEQNSLGKSHYQWNCSWNGDAWSDKALTGRVTHLMPLPAAPQEFKP